MNINIYATVEDLSKANFTAIAILATMHNYAVIPSTRTINIVIHGRKIGIKFILARCGLSTAIRQFFLCSIVLSSAEFGIRSAKYGCL